MTSLSVIIVNYNSGDRLARCLEHLSRQTYRDFEVIVVDNASADGSLGSAIASAPAPLSPRVIDAGSNLGFAAANNLAAREATGEWLVFLNPDAYAERDWLSALVSASGRYPWADAFGSTQLNADNPATIDGAGDVVHVLGIPYRGHFGWPADQLPEDGECFAPCAAAAMYRRAAFLHLGGFEESFFCYGEDVDLGFRLRLAGGRSVQVKAARVLHEGSGISGRYSDFTVYHGNRNRIWMTFRNMPGALYWPLLPLRLIADAYLCLRASSAGTGRAYLRGVLDGYAGLPALAGDRRKLQRARKARLRDIAAALTWSPFKVSKREAVLAPILPHRATR
ncbi:MAG: glycosyltransferase family 2 protein [Parvularculaceae bacterium]